MTQDSNPKDALAGRSNPTLAGPPLNRRDILAFAVAAGGLAVVSGPAAAADADGAASAARDQPFDSQWKFWKGVLSGAEEVAFDDSKWRTVDTPHDWSIEDLPQKGAAEDGRATVTAATWTDLKDVPERVGPFDSKESEGGRSTGYAVGGEGWYRKAFVLAPPTDGRRVELRFDGVFQNADIWLNGVPLGFHPYGYTPILLNLTPHLRKEGANTLAVRVRNVGKTSRWYSGSGINRHVWLSVTPALRVAHWGVSVTTPTVTAGAARVLAEVRLANAGKAATAQVRATLLDSRGRTVAAAQVKDVAAPGSAEAAVQFEFAVANPALWSPDAPNLHTVRAEVLADGKVTDTTVTPFGIRSISVSGATGFLLNGKLVKMRGVNLHQDLGALGGVALEQGEERRIQILKTCGFNAIRTSHQPPSPAFLDACDRIGMLVIDELFDMWDGAKGAEDYHLYFTEWWERDLTAVIRRDRNHPCVVFWSIGNEVARKAPGNAVGFTPRFNGSESYGQLMADKIKSIDPTRFVIQGGALGIATLFSLKPDAQQWNYLDVGDGHYQKDYAVWRQAHPDKAMIQTESWAAAIYADWKRVADNVWMVGDFIWTGWDYLGEVGVGAPMLFDIGSPPRTEDGPTSTQTYPWIAANCGDFDLIGQPKPQYFYRKVVWGDSALEMAVERPAPAGKEQRRFMWSFFDELQSWTWDVAAGAPMKVRVYANADQVRLLLNGKVVQTKVLAAADELIATFVVPYAPGVLTAVALKGGKEVARRSLSTVGAAAGLRLRSDVKALAAHRGSLAHVLVEVVDAQGRLVPDAIVPVSFELAGTAQLASVGNGNPRNVHSFQQPKVYTFQGRALAVLRSAGDSNSASRFTATSPGLKADILAI